MAASGKLRARVFISCGQKKGDEARIADLVRSRVDKCGFEPILIGQQTTFAGVVENVFRALGSAEYFLFVDFFREGENISLFSHQELAVAAFLDRDWAVLRDRRLEEKRSGLMGFVPTAPEYFDDIEQVPEKVEAMLRAKIASKEWDVDWRRGLQLKLRTPPPSDAWAPVPGGGLKLTRFFQVDVRNLDHIRVARSCVAYIEEFRELPAGAEKDRSLVPLKWSGVTSATVEIPPKGLWHLDLFRTPRATTDGTLAFNPFITDWGGIVGEYTLQANTEYSVGIVVYTDSFAPARARFHVTFGADSNDIAITQTG